jgi:DNA primase large subunit
MSTPINCLDLFRGSYVEDMASTYALPHAKERLSSATDEASAPMISIIRFRFIDYHAQ